MSQDEKGRYQFTPGQEIACTVVELWAAVSNTDTNEGRGKSIDVSYHLNQDDAALGAVGIGVQGTDGSVTKRLALRINNESYLLITGNPVSITSVDQKWSELRQSGRAKLTPAERIALGIEE